MSDEVSEKPKRVPDECSWYLLATLYGVPEPMGNEELRAKNRVAWNRYMALWIGEEECNRLVNNGRKLVEELRPFTPDEFQDIEKAFAARSCSQKLMSIN